MIDPEIAALAARIAPTDVAAAAEAQRLLDGKTKPRRSLGRLEDLVCQLAAIRRDATPPPPPTKAIVVMGADHGVAAEGVSAYPQEVTAQMLLNFARGGAAINVLARQAGARVVVVDMGVAQPLPAGSAPEVRVHRIGAGTASFARGPAMTHAQAAAALSIGAGLAGVVLGAAAARVPVIVDGFIASVATLAAVRLAPAAAGYLIASHRSVETGHRLVLQALGVKPLLDLELRLGEGTGAALAMPLVDAALAIAAEMATFESAGVSSAAADRAGSASSA